MARNKNIKNSKNTSREQKRPVLYPPELYDRLYQKLMERFSNGDKPSATRINAALQELHNDNNKIHVPNPQTIDNILTDWTRRREKQCIDALITLAFNLPSSEAATPDEWLRQNEFAEQSSVKINTSSTPQGTASITAYRSFEILMITDELLGHAQAEICFFCITLDYVFQMRNKEFIEAMERGITITAIVLSPDTPRSTLSDYAISIGVTARDLHSRCEGSITWVLNIMKEWQESSAFDPAKLQIYLSSNPPHMRVFLADHHSPNSLAFVGPYINYTTRGPMFKAVNHAADIPDAYLLESIEKIMAQATPLTRFLEDPEHSHFLEEYDGLLEAYLEH